MKYQNEEVSLKFIVVLKCHLFSSFNIGPMISFGNFGTGKFLYEWRSHEYRNSKFSVNHERYIANPPMNGLAGVVKLFFTTTARP